MSLGPALVFDETWGIEAPVREKQHGDQLPHAPWVVLLSYQVGIAGKSNASGPQLLGHKIILSSFEWNVYLGA